MKPTKVVRVNDDDDNNNLSPCITSSVLNVFQCWMGGYSTLTLLKQLGTAALKALKHIENTGQTSTGFRTHRVWLQASSSPDAEWCRAWWGTLHQLLILSWCALSFIFLPTEVRSWGPLLPTGTWHQHLHTQVAVRPLPLGSSERTKGKIFVLSFPRPHWGHWCLVRWTFCPWKTEVEPILWNRDYWSHHYVKWGASASFFKTLVPVFSLNTIKAITVVFILWTKWFNTPIIPLTKPFVSKGVATVQMKDLSQGISIRSEKLKHTAGIKYFNPES